MAAKASRKVNKLQSMIERSVGPAATVVTFGQPLFQAYGDGGAGGVIQKVKQTVLTWHPPTIEGFMNFIEGSGGASLVEYLTALGVEFVGDMSGVGIVKDGGRVLRKAAQGALAGNFTRLLAFPTDYNPHGPSINPASRYVTANTPVRAWSEVDPKGVRATPSGYAVAR